MLGCQVRGFCIWSAAGRVSAGHEGRGWHGGWLTLLGKHGGGESADRLPPAGSRGGQSSNRSRIRFGILCPPGIPWLPGAFSFLAGILPSSSHPGRKSITIIVAITVLAPFQNQVA